MGISVKELTQIYGTQRAVDNISFEIPKGEIVGFLGPNGAGKTTTMKIITCYMPPTQGTVLVDGLHIAEHSLEIRRKIGYLPEHNPLYLDMYIHEFLRFVARLNHVEKKLRDKRVREVIEMTGLGREQSKKIGMLSKGYRQRVGLAQALLHNPEILILDEPTTGLDPNQIVEIRNLIREIGREKTVIFSTHILPEVEKIADRVLIINQGQLVADEEIEQLRKITESLVLRVVFEQDGFDMEGLAAGIEGVGIKTFNEREFLVTMPQGVDLRPEILRASLDQQIPIAFMQRGEWSLEEIFRKLTS